MKLSSQWCVCQVTVTPILPTQSEVRGPHYCKQKSYTLPINTEQEGAIHETAYKSMLLKSTKHYFPIIPHALETMLSVDLLTNNPVHMPKVSLRGYWHVKSCQQRQLCLFSKKKKNKKNSLKKESLSQYYNTIGFTKSLLKNVNNYYLLLVLTTFLVHTSIILTFKNLVQERHYTFVKTYRMYTKSEPKCKLCTW